MSDFKLGANNSSLFVQRQLAKHAAVESQAKQRISTGLRINKTSDDAAGLALSTELSVDARVASQNVRNVNDGISATSIANGAIDVLTSIAARQAELANQAANGATTDEQRAALQAESVALTEEYNRIVTKTAFGTRSIFGSPWEQIDIAAGGGVEGILSLGLGNALGNEITGGSYFTYSTPLGDFYVWYTVDGAGDNPNLAGRTGYLINLSSNPDGVKGQSTIQAVDPGSIVGGTAFGYTDYTNYYYFWFDTGGTPDPFGGDPSAFRIDISAAVTAEDVAAAIAAAIESSGLATAESNGDLVTLTDNQAGSNWFVEDYDTGLAVQETVNSQYGTSA